MASAEEYAAWIVKNADKKGTPEFDTVAKAYQLAKSAAAASPAAPGSTKPSAAGAQLGRSTQAPDPTLPYYWNKFKEGFFGVPALAGMAQDVLTLPGRTAVKAATAAVTGEPVRKAVTSDLAPATKLYSTGAPELYGYKPGMPVPKDEYGKPSLRAEIGGNIAGFAGAGALGGAGVVSRSATPIKAIAKEIAGIVLGGEGQTMGGHAVPEKYKPVGEFVGSLMGPGLAQGAVEAASKGGNWVKTGAQKLGFSGISEQARLQAGAEKAAKELAPQLSSPVSKSNIAQATQIGAKIPGFSQNLTLGRTTGSPVVKAMEKHFGTTVPEALETAQAREKGLQSSIEQYASKRFPASPEGVTATTGVVRAYETKAAALDLATARLEAQQNALAERLTRGDMESAGAEIKSVRERLMDAARQAKDMRYKAVYAAADESGMKVNMDDVKKLASDINKDAGNAFQGKPGVIGKILARYKTSQAAEKSIKTPVGREIHLRGTAQEAPAKPVSFEEFHSLYMEANREASELAIAAKMGSSEAAQKLRYVNAVRQQLQAKLNEMEGAQHGEVGKLLADANSYYKNKYSALFKRGVGGEMARANRFGPSTENAKIIPQLIFKPGDASGVKEYLAMAQGDPQAYRALESGIMDILSKKVVVNGKVSKAALDSFLKTYHEPLSELPGIRKAIESVRGAADSLSKNAALVQQERSAFGKSLIAKIARTENPDQVVAKAIQSPSTMSTLLSSATNQQEKQAVARSLMEQIGKQSDPIAYLSANEKLLTNALGSKQVGFLKTIFNAQKIANAVETPTHLAFEKLQDPLSTKIGTSIPQAVSEAKMVQLRMGSRAYALARVGVRFWNKLRNDKRDEILMDAIYNPQMAEMLAKYMDNPIAKTASDLNAHLAAYGVRAGVLGFNLVNNQNPPKEQKPLSPVSQANPKAIIGGIDTSLPKKMPKKTYPDVLNYSGPPRG